VQESPVGFDQVPFDDAADRGDQRADIGPEHRLIMRVGGKLLNA
jgi:hypothetical protein